MSGMSEAEREALAMDTLGELAWETAAGKAIAPGSGERESWREPIIPGRLRAAVERINPGLPEPAVDEAVKAVLSPKSRDALGENHQVHQYLTGGIRSVVYADEHGADRNPTIRLIDYADPYANDFLAVNQVVVTDGDHRRRFDIVLYVNGMPLGVVELKKAGDEHAHLEGAHAQVMTYVAELPLAFRCNVACVVSDGIRARYGTAFTPFEHYAPWNVDDEGRPVPPNETDSDLAVNLPLHGLFEQRRFIEILGGYVAFAQSDGGLVKRIAKPHQYFAMSKAVRKTLEAVRSNGHAGVVWHTQGSGKSMEMELYASGGMAASCSPRCRSSARRRRSGTRDGRIRCCRTAATSSSSWTRRTAVTTTT
jgi:type I restriction enzyme, R subunit